MYRALISCLLLLFLFDALKGQSTIGGEPYSLTLGSLKSTAPLPVVNLQKLDIDKLLQEDIGHNGPFRYGIFTDTILNIKLLGKADIIPSRGTIWRMRISSENAKSIQLVFKTFVLPTGASLFLYNENKSLQTGAYTSKNNRRDSALVMPDFFGNHLYLEYFEPFDASFGGEVIIGSISQAYKDLRATEEASTFININCPQGKLAQLPKHAVGKMSFRSGSYSALCTGALINNARQDGTPYFLTAHHCISEQAEASSLITYFNYENSGCSGPELTPLSVSGAELLSTSAPSDYTLLRLHGNLTAAFQPYFAGWDVRDTAVFGVTSIHHPQGFTKKLAIDKDTLISNPDIVRWNDDSQSPVGSHWVVSFDEGKTDQGSSGGPLFNSENQIIGQLHGGDDILELFGKLSYSYANIPSGFPELRRFLDPDSSEIMVLNGFSPADNIPDAFFTTDFSPVCVSSPVTFTDYSAFGPYTRKWLVYPGVPIEDFAFLNGTTDSSAIPVIAFNKEQDFTVQLDLLVSDTVRSSEIFSLKAGSLIETKVKTGTGDPLCDCDFEKIELMASGADIFLWKISAEDSVKAFLENNLGDTAILIRNADFQADSGYTVNLLAIGVHGTCSDTAKVILNLVRPVNDNIAHAIALPYGKSEYFSNVCATVEDNEPIPPFFSCTSQSSWCDEYGTGEDIVENSVWFRFVASQTGLVSISSTGFDNQIALYEAESYADILSGDYTLLAANDDRTSSDARPLIKTETVITGKTYWIQADGSAGGMEDNFYLNIVELTPTQNYENPSSDLILYPQPAGDNVYIKSEDFSDSQVNLVMHNISGLCVFDSEVAVDQGIISLNIASFDTGIYLVSIKTGKKIYFAKLIKR